MNARFSERLPKLITANCASSTIKKKTPIKCTTKNTKSIYYAVAFGRKTGVFCKDWSEIKWLVLKYVGSRFKKFNNIADGWKFVLNLNKDISAPCNLQTFTDISTEEIERFKKLHDEHTKALTSEKELRIGNKSSDLIMGQI